MSVELPTEPVTLYGDAVRLTQVLANLLTNAAKYTNAGGHIWIQVRKEGDRAIVSVRDNGIGIAADQLASVFDMFTQVDRSSRWAQGGLGIGLTLVRQVQSRVVSANSGLPATMVSMEFKRITTNPRQMDGVPCLRGLRIPVATVVALVAEGQTTENILALYPDLEADDVREALLFAAEAVRERALPLAAGE